MSSSKPTLFLLDAMALIYRAHFAFIKAPRYTSKGLNTSVVFGFTNTILEVLQKEKPTHLAIAFDTSAPTFRHIEYKEYKAQRDAQPEDITLAIPYVCRLAEAMNIPVLKLDGYEADDIIGTIAQKAEKEGFKVYMMTPDKDYGQLVTEDISIYKPAFMGKGAEKLGVKEILERWNINRIDQVIDMLGLMGDAVDNIPGIPGVGEKTAQKLIQEYDTIDNLLANAHSIKGKLGEKVRANGEQALFSKRLATIEVNVPITCDLEQMRVVTPNKEAVSTLFDDLEFKTLRHRVLGSQESASTVVTPSATTSNTPQTGQLDLFASPTTPSSQAIAKESTSQLSLFDNSNVESSEGFAKRNIENTRHYYHIIDTPALRQNLAQFLAQQTLVCFDTETTSINAVEAEIVGISFSYQAGEAFYVPCPAEREEALAVLADFKPFFENETIAKTAQNIKYDLLLLRSYGIEVKGELHDTMLAHYLMEPEKRHNMDLLANIFLNYEPINIESLIGKKGNKQGNMRDVAIDEIAEYAGEDADITLQIHEKIVPPMLTSHAGDLYKNVEMPLVQVLADMEYDGVKVDVDTLKEMSLVLETDLKSLEEAIFSTAGEQFNINSPKQLGEILFDKLKLVDKPKKTKTGQYATGEDILSDLESSHEIVRKILDYRELQKLKSTYVDALPELINPKTGRIHTSYNQAVTATGRLSSTNPNLQNIPIRTTRGKEIRKAFVASSDEYVILSADYSQIELRIMAAFSKDATMLHAFDNGQDIHASTASKVFKTPLEEVTSDMRRKAKMVNFGIIYGISAFGLAQRLGIARSEASQIIQAYFEEFPAVKSYMDSVIEGAKENEYVETILGRRRYLPDINSRNPTNRGFAERNAINAPIQGSAADMIKIAMIKIQEFIKSSGLKSRMILQVHDELIFEAHKSEVELLKQKVDELMQTAIVLPVKIETGIGIGNNWLEAH